MPHALSRKPTPLPWRTIAFVADLLEVGVTGLPAETRTDLERTDQEIVDGVVGAIRDLGLDCLHFKSPRDLAENAGRLRRALVLSTYAGGPSRSRLTLVPAMAEALGLSFVGLDAAGQALAHDKEVMKRIAQECGVLTPRWRVIRDTIDAEICGDFPAPYVLKPIAEGSSIGISQRNLVRDPADGVILARELLAIFKQPVLVEEFVAGREVSFVSIEATPTPLQCFVEVVVEGHPDYFSSHLFDATEKLHRRLPRSICLVDDDLHPADKKSISRLLKTIGHYGVIRVDGKLIDGRFVFLELTPDPWLGVRGHVAEGFAARGMRYVDVIEAILASALLAPRGRVAIG